MGELHVYVDDDVLQAFKNYVLAKYGSLHRYLGEEVSRALDYYLTHAASAHTQEFEHKVLKVNKRHVKLLTWIGKGFNHEITYSDIEKYIVENFGIDRRTKKSYINFLVRSNFIKPKRALYGKDIIYEVNTRKIYDFLRKYMKEEELRDFAISIVENKSNGKSNGKLEAKVYAVERYEMGDSIEEIAQKLEDFGLNFTKQSTRNFLRKTLREVRD